MSVVRIVDSSANAIDLELAKVIFREDLYPRIRKSPETVQKYAEDLSVLPPIEVNQHYELIDGWHRWTAHKKLEARTIAVIVTHTANETELLELAISRNAAHGLQLSQDDKKDMARRIYHVTPEKEREGKKALLARILSVDLSTVHRWLSRIDKDAKEARDQRIFAAWLACDTQDEIAERENLSKATVSDICSEICTYEKLNKSDRASADHAVSFDTPIYNIWKQQEKTPGSSHFGNSEVRWVDNLLYLYTQPFDVVVDLFAGGGSTVDICRKRFRRYWVSDRKPIVERESDIRAHDVMDGLPRLPWKDVKLVYLDPPYWKQAEGQYSDDKADLANMELQEFNSALSGLVRDLGKKMTAGHIAVLIQPTQWKAPDRKFTDHIADLISMVKLPIEMRYSVPYESQQCNPQMVEWAKANKKCLVLTRELIVWRVE